MNIERTILATVTMPFDVSGNSRFPNAVKLGEGPILGLVDDSRKLPRFLMVERIAFQLTGVTLDEGILRLTVSAFDTPSGREFLNEVEQGGTFSPHLCLTREGVVEGCLLVREEARV